MPETPLKRKTTAPVLYLILILGALAIIFSGSPNPVSPGPGRAGPSVGPGPAVGENTPSFHARDQHGEWQDLKTLSGPAGAVFLFHRSADW